MALQQGNERFLQLVRVLDMLGRLRQIVLEMPAPHGNMLEEIKQQL